MEREMEREMEQGTFTSTQLAPSTALSSIDFPELHHKSPQSPLRKGIWLFWKRNIEASAAILLSLLR